MRGTSRKKKKATIFRMFLIPMIIIMLVQSVITIGTLVAMGTVRTLEEYSSGMMNRLVENRQMMLQNEMNQRWASIREQEAAITSLLEQTLAREEIGLEELMLSSEKREQLLQQLFPECLDILRLNSTTGIFLILTGGTDMAAGEYDGFFIRDSDPEKNPVNYSDFLLERGNKQLSREWGIPLDSCWTTRFHMDGQGQNSSDCFFYEPWRAGQQYPEADTEDLGYWAPPFFLEKGTMDSHEMITYSLPLRYQGQTYAVLGVEISCRSLYNYFPAAELNENQQSGYLLAIQGDRYVPLVGKGILYDLVRSGGGFELEETAYNGLAQIQDVRLNGQRVYAAAYPLKLYSNNVPYENTNWVLLGLNTEDNLFGLSQQLYVWMVAAVLAGLAFGVVGIYLAVRYLTTPIQRLMQCIRGGQAGLQSFKAANILEIDALYDVVNDLTNQQKEAENILLAEKERYKVALESSEDTFFTYDLHSQTLDVVNHPTMSGRWKCPRTENGFINSDFIHEDDRQEAVKALRQTSDTLYAEFRLRWPEEAEFTWIALGGKAVRDTDGQRWKIVGSIRNIQEQKEKEAEQRRKNAIDGTTGLYGFSAGINRLEQCRREQPEGVMVTLSLENLRQINERNGIVFGDMILEEAGVLLRKHCQALAQETGGQTMALRLNGQEFVLWLEGVSRERAARFIEQALNRAAVLFPNETFQVGMSAGLAAGTSGQDSRELIRMAKLAQGRVQPDDKLRYRFYEAAMRDAPLPPVREREFNSLGYSEDVSLVSIALNLFGKGSDFHAQMMLLIRKIDRFYQAGGVLVSLLRDDFNSSYLEYQWSRDGRYVANENARKYHEEEKAAFFKWLDQKDALYFSPEDSRQRMLQCFLGVMPGQEGIALPLYDSGNYIGNICILDVSQKLLENPEDEQGLVELSQVIQSQISQQQHDIASKAKSEFLSRMSHEIRTPMNGIIGMTAIALQQDQSPERVMDCLQKIRSSSNYLLGLINDILDMSKIESGKMKLEPVNFNMNQMLDTIQDLIAPQATAKEVRFVPRVELAHSWFLADQVRISQVLINLLSNAVKFTSAKGQVILTVQEGAVHGEDALVYFAVRDTGVGIAKEDQARVFRSFEQAAGANSLKRQGTGLGLSISSRLVQMMGSSIQLDSEPGEGSTFSFSIPLALGHQESENKQEKPVSFDGLHILVVEDNELNAEIAQSLLEERGFEVDWARDGAEAVERIRSTSPGSYDVILMDIMMPVMDGLEATKAIRSMDREDCRTIPIIAMSANAFDDDLKKSVECGMNGHLSKPVNVDKLYQTLGQILQDRKK